MILNPILLLRLDSVLKIPATTSSLAGGKREGRKEEGEEVLFK